MAFPTNWNPSDNSGSTLSNSNKTAVGGCVRTVQYGGASEKLYFEVVTGSGGGSAGSAVGFANASFAVATDDSSNSANAITAWTDGNIYFLNSAVAGWGTPNPPAGTVISCAIDTTLKKIWVRQGSGNWNNSGTDNPATGTGGASITGAGPYTAIYQGPDALTVTLQAATLTVPSGFTDMMASGATAADESIHNESYDDAQIAIDVAQQAAEFSILDRSWAQPLPADLAVSATQATFNGYAFDFQDWLAANESAVQDQNWDQPTPADVATGGITFVQKGSDGQNGGGGGTFSSFSSPPTIGNVLYAYVSTWASGGTTATVVDNKGNIWSLQIRAGGGSGTNEAAELWSATVTATGASFTVSATTANSSADVNLTAVEFSGVSATKDQTASAVGFALTSQTAGPTSTLSSANELVLACLSAGGDATPLSSAASGYTNLVYVPNGSAIEGAIFDYKIVAATTAVSAAYTGGSSASLVSVLATFPASGGAAPDDISIDLREFDAANVAIDMLWSDATYAAVLDQSWLDQVFDGTALNYPLPITTGTYAIAGNAVGLAFGRAMGITTGAYVVAGQAVGLKFGRVLPIVLGTYAVAGQAVGLAFGRKTPITTGAYTVAGQAVGLARGLKLAITTGAYVISGNAVGLARGYKVAITAGAYTITGNAVGLTYARGIAITTGVYTVTGYALLLKFGRALQITTGAYVVSGNAVSLVNAGKQVNIVAGVYAVTGNAVALTVQRRLTITTGAYAVAGQALGLARGYRVSITAGSYTVGGVALALTQQHRMPITSGSYTVNGIAMALVYSAGPPPAADGLGIGGDTLIGKYRGELLAELHTLSRRTY